MKRAQWLWLALSVAGLAFAGCGDDDTNPMVDSGPPPVDGGGTDAGMTEGCAPPATPPACHMEDVGMGACCYRESNESRLDAPELRVAFLQLAEPPILASNVIANLLNRAIRDERFNWLIRVEGADADGEVSITTGFGEKATDGTFAFADGSAPTDGGGDPNRWDPQTLTGDLAGETITSGALDNVFTVPVLNETNPEEVDLELPLRGFRLIGATMNDNRSCIGTGINAERFCSQDGTVETFITVEDARNGQVVAGGLMSTLCNILRNGIAAGLADCEDTPREEWATPPNSTCSGGGTCTFGGCTATTCNAWRVAGGFAAQGVEITN